MQQVEEKLAGFYLGQEYELSERKALEQAVMYDARDLTTHAVIVGMTGSGKTGLGVIILEEAALDRVPSIVIDPKGDMTNLLLTFPELRPEDFQPWVNPDDARRKNLEVEEFAAVTASQWQKGLAATGQGPDRIRRLKESAEFAVYTPGSSAGRSLSILDSFRVPELAWDTDAELLRDKIESVVSALLGLVGIQADPMRSREHILLANIIERAWRDGQDLSLEQIINLVQKPPFGKLGAFPVETFYPEKERMGLAMLLNGLLASPTFAVWTQGEPLNVDSLLHSPTEKPRVSVVYIAHLSEAERQFFVTLLLEQVVSWVRAQTGTTSLRALLYMDEMFGYLPPIGNPPSKKPLLTLLKQARAFGFGLVLATQNPVDLDYKALSNAGTWFVGRMQADRDKQRLLDGLEGIQITGGLRRSDFDKIISAIQSRVFLLHNVNQDKPTIFTTRWAMSYLRGPLTLAQVRQLPGMQVSPAAGARAVPKPAGAPEPTASTAAKPESLAPPPFQPIGAGFAYSQVPPQLPSEIRQAFLPVQVPFEAAFADWVRQSRASVRSQARPEPVLVYEPGILGLAKIYYSHAQSRQSFEEEVAYLVPAGSETVDWSAAKASVKAKDLTEAPRPGSCFAELPLELGSAKNLKALERQLEEHVFYKSVFALRYNPHLKLYSRADETADAFLRRCRKEAEAVHQAEARKVRERYAAKRAQLEDKLKREQRELELDKAEHSARKQEELLTGAELLFGALSGRRVSRRLSSAGTKRRMSRRAKADVRESEEAIKDLQAEIEKLSEQEQQELDALSEKWNRLINEVEEAEIRPRRSDVQISLFAVAWIPRWEVTVAGQTLSLPAFDASGSG